jgi:dCMP deaminase
MAAMETNKLGWDELFFNLIKEYRAKSKDPSSQFAAIIVNDDHDPISFGFNGFPRKVDDSPERYANRELKYKIVQHAEANAIVNAASNGKATKGCSIYIDTWPCSNCCGMIINAKIKEVVLNGDSEIHNNAAFQERWKESIELTKMLFREAGIKIRIYKKDEHA